MLTGGFDARRGRHRPRLRRRWPAASGVLPDVPPVRELLRRHLPAAVGVRAADRRGRCWAVRPPAVGRGDGRALPAAVRARVHQLGPVRGRAGHARAVGVGAAAAGARRRAPRPGRWRRSSTRCCCSARCSCSACGPAGCAPGCATAVAAGVAWLVVEPADRAAGAGQLGAVLRLNSSRPADPDTIWNIAAAPRDDRLFDGPLADGQTPTVLNAVVAVVLLAARSPAVGWLTLAAPVRPRVPSSRSCSWPASCC